MEKIAYVELTKTPIGNLFIAASSKGLVFLSFGNQAEKELIRQESKRFGTSSIFRKVRSSKRASSGEGMEKQLKIINESLRQLGDYFTGRLRKFTMKKDYSGLTVFEKKVLQELDKIPYGKTSSYQEIARKVRKPKAARAVGNAVGKNPFAIIVPCHRVIKSDGSIGGFGAPISIKKNLLAHEKNIR